MKTTHEKKSKKIIGSKMTKKVIAYRKSSNTQGTGLTHYILLDNKTR